MYIFIFRITLEEETAKGAGRKAGKVKKQTTVKLHADGMCKEASLAGKKEPPAWLAEAARFSFDKPFTPKKLHEALRRSGISFEFETGYPGNITAEASDNPEEEDDSIIRRTVLDHYIVSTRLEEDEGVLYCISVTNTDKDLDHGPLFAAARSAAARKVHNLVVGNLRNGRPLDDGTEELIDGFLILAAAPPAPKPDWLLSVCDILAGRYDKDPDEILRLLKAAADKLDTPGFNPIWAAVVHQAAQYAVLLVRSADEDERPAPAAKPADGAPDWLLPMYDILNGRYDSRNCFKTLHFFADALQGLYKPGCTPDPGWKAVIKEAAEHQVSLFADIQEGRFASLAACGPEAKPGKKRAGSSRMPKWLKDLHDVIDGKYDGSPDAICFLFENADNAMHRHGADPAWKDVYVGASAHLMQAVMQHIWARYTPAAGRKPELGLMSAQDEAGSAPDWVLDMYDILAGRYDDDADMMRRLLDAAEAARPGCSPAWRRLAGQAAEHAGRLVKRQSPPVPGVKKAKKAAEAGGAPDWVLAMYDIIAGRYDDDVEKMLDLIQDASDELDRQGACDPGWSMLVYEAIQHARPLLDQVQIIEPEADEPDWMLPMYDILAGRYDDEGYSETIMQHFVNAYRELQKSGGDPHRAKVIERASRYANRLFAASQAEAMADELPAGSTGEKPAGRQAEKQARTGRSPKWLKGLKDIISGRCDNDISKMCSLLAAAEDEAAMPGCAPAWKKLFDQASGHMMQLAAARGRDLFARPAAGPVKKPVRTAADPNSGLRVIRTQPKAVKPDWVLSLFDVIVGEYDDAPLKMIRLIKTAAEEAEKPGCDPSWASAIDLAVEHLTEVLTARGCNKS